MRSRAKKTITHLYCRLVVLAVLAVIFVAGCSKKQTGNAAESSPKTFSTPAEAGQALEAAARAKDDKAIAQVLGPKAKALVSSGDSSVDAAANDSFAKKYDRMHRWVLMTDGSQVLYVGADNYPFPVPLKQDSGSRWYFDAVTGEEELRARRIGKNEMRAVEAAEVIANAEKSYHQATHRYTGNLVSTPGQQDGLYWEASEGKPLSPLGSSKQFARGVFAAAAPSQTLVFDGYSYRVITSKKGFTVFATPAKYEHSGIMTFSLGRDGIVYQRDLGKQAADAENAINQYNPADGWAQAE